MNGNKQQLGKGTELYPPGYRRARSWEPSTWGVPLEMPRLHPLESSLRAFDSTLFSSFHRLYSLQGRLSCRMTAPVSQEGNAHLDGHIQKEECRIETWY